MTQNEKLKLSELPDDVELSIEESRTTYTVAELKREIVELGEPHHESSNWLTLKPAQWIPCADSMIERYIEDQADDMYEDWDEKANDCVDKETVKKIQALLVEMFKPARDYWLYDKPVEIDIFPPVLEAPHG